MVTRLLRALGLGLVGVLLFAQIAIAAHACSGLPSAVSMNQQSVAAGWPDDPACSLPMGAAGDELLQVQDGAGAGAVEPAMTLICAGHCLSGQQSDQTPSFSVPAVLLNARYGLPSLAGPALPRPAVTETGKLAAASPPHAILHCCFRL